MRARPALASHRTEARRSSLGSLDPEREIASRPRRWSVAVEHMVPHPRSLAKIRAPCFESYEQWQRLRALAVARTRRTRRHFARSDDLDAATAGLLRLELRGNLTRGLAAVADLRIFLCLAASGVRRCAAAGVARETAEKPTAEAQPQRDSPRKEKAWQHRQDEESAQQPHRRHSTKWSRSHGAFFSCRTVDPCHEDCRSHRDRRTRCGLRDQHDAAGARSR
jgi:hypothetical protein